MWVVWDNEDKKKLWQTMPLRINVEVKKGIVSRCYKPCINLKIARTFEAVVYFYRNLRKRIYKERPCHKFVLCSFKIYKTLKT